MIKDDLNYFSNQPGGVIFSPALTGEIDKLNTSLLLQNFSPIPEDYAAFLKMSNGMFYDGIELYGCSSHYREAKNYKFPDLKEINQNYADYHFFHNKLVIGRCSESLIYYDHRAAIYALADRINLRSRQEVESFTALFALLRQLCETNA